MIIILSGDDQGAGGGTEVTGPNSRGQEALGDRGQVRGGEIYDFTEPFCFQGGGRSQGSSGAVPGSSVSSPRASPELRRAACKHQVIVQS